MSLELRDLRAKITVETDQVLDAVAAARGILKCELARQILSEWAEEQISLAHHILAAIGREVGPRTVVAPNCPLPARRLRLEIYERDGGKCTYCKAELVRDGFWHIDHVKPLAAGGVTEPTNLVLACASCNSSKGARTPAQWKAA
jgi:hypothetical protein